MKASKSGTFIAELRREKNWTQAELAKRLGVTDKAISRWETGKGYPDVTILKRLSEELEVTISEILSGERIPEELQLEKAEEVILKNIKQNKDKMMTAATGLFFINLILLLISLRLTWSLGVVADALNHISLASCGPFWMDWLRLGLLTVSFGLSAYLLSAGSRDE